MILKEVAKKSHSCSKTLGLHNILQLFLLEALDFLDSVSSRMSSI